MSVSTASLDFHSDRSSLSDSGMAQKATPRTKKSITEAIRDKDSRHASDIVKEGWNSELTGRIHILPNDVNDYISLCVPSPSEPPSRALPNNLFDQWQPVAGKEKDMYPLLVR